jgi:hypothetical protein
MSPARQAGLPSTSMQTSGRPVNRRSLSYSDEKDRFDVTSSPSAKPVTSVSQPPSPGGPRRSSSDPRHSGAPSLGRSWVNGQHLPPIPGSPYATEGSLPPSRKSSLTPSNDKAVSKYNGAVRRSLTASPQENGTPRSRSKSSPYVPQRGPPQSLNAAVEMFASPHEKAPVSENGHSPTPLKPGTLSEESSVSEDGDRPMSPGIEKNNIYGRGYTSKPSSSPIKERPPEKRDVPPSPRRPVPATPNAGNFWSTRSASTPSPPSRAGKDISDPVLNHGEHIIDCITISKVDAYLPSRSYIEFEPNEESVRWPTNPCAHSG